MLRGLTLLCRFVPNFQHWSIFGLSEMHPPLWSTGEGHSVRAHATGGIHVLGTSDHILERNRSCTVWIVTDINRTVHVRNVTWWQSTGLNEAFRLCNM